MRRKIWPVALACLLGCLLYAPVAFADPEEPVLSAAPELLYEPNAANDIASAEFVVSSAAGDEGLGSLMKYISSVGAAYPDCTIQDFTLSVGVPVGGHKSLVVIGQPGSGDASELEAGQGLLSIAIEGDMARLDASGKDAQGVAKAVSFASNPDSLSQVNEPSTIVVDQVPNWAAPQAAVGGSGGGDSTSLDTFLAFGSGPVVFCDDELGVPTQALIAAQVAHRAGQQSARVLDWRVADVAEASDAADGSGNLVFVGDASSLAAMPSEVKDVLPVVPQADGTLGAGADGADIAADADSVAVFEAVASPYSDDGSVFVIICPDGMVQNVIALMSDQRSLGQLRGNVATLDAQGAVGTVADLEPAARQEQDAALAHIADDIEQQVGLPWWVLLVALIAVLCLIVALVVINVRRRQGSQSGTSADAGAGADEVADGAAAAGVAADAEGEDALATTGADAEGEPRLETGPEPEPELAPASELEEEPQPEGEPEPAASEVRPQEPDADKGEGLEPEEVPARIPAAVSGADPLYDPDAVKESEEAYEKALEEFRRFRESL